MKVYFFKVINFFCDNIVEVNSRGLNKKFEVNLLGRKSKKLERMK